MDSINYPQRDGYRVAPYQVPSSGFLTPPSPYEVRRDSVASSQSSYCQSFAASDCSASTDRSVPVTPTCGRSPLAEDGFVDAMSYDMAHDFQAQGFHGLPLASQPKNFIEGDMVGDPWIMVPSLLENNATHTLPFRTHDILPASESFGPTLHTQTTIQPSLNGMFVSVGEPTWTGHQPLWTVNELQHNRGVDHISRVSAYDAEPLHMYYPELDASQTGHVHGLPPGTIVPSDAMFDAQDEFVHVNSDEFGGALEDSHSFGQSPQEVYFKREDSISVKEEPDIEEHKPVIKRSICETSTGGKSVKRERRNGGVSKKRSKDAHSQVIVVPMGENEKLRVRLDGIEMNRATGRYVRTSACKREKHRCHEFLADGRPCMRSFARPEHLKRHVGTHSGMRDFSCRICPKLFNRNDNCMEHYWTHVQRPGKKPGRNDKMSLRSIEEIVGDPKIIEKLRRKWKAEVEDASATGS